MGLEESKSATALSNWIKIEKLYAKMKLLICRFNSYPINLRKWLLGVTSGQCQPFEMPILGICHIMAKKTINIVQI